GGAPLPAAARPVSAAHHRQQRLGWAHRYVDRALHLPQLAAAVGRADCPRQRGPVRPRGLAQLRPRLRPDPAVLAEQHRCRVGHAGPALRLALPAHVAVLPGRVDGQLPQPPRPAVAGPDVAGGRAGGRGGTALSGGEKFATPLVTPATAGAPAIIHSFVQGSSTPPVENPGAKKDATRRWRLRGPQRPALSRPRFLSSGSIRGSCPAKSRNRSSASRVPPRDSRVARKWSPFSRF